MCSLVGEADGTISLFRPSSGASGHFAAVPSGLSYVRAVQVGADAAPVMGDVTSDGQPDLLVGAADGMVRLYVNEGTVAAPRFVLHANATLATAAVLASVGAAVPPGATGAAPRTVTGTTSTVGSGASVRHAVHPRTPSAIATSEPGIAIRVRNRRGGWGIALLIPSSPVR